MTQTSDFEGFPLPTKNFFSLPNEMINIIAHINHLAEMKVIIYIIRHTWGYQEYGSSKPISTDEFMHGRRRRDGSRIDEGTGLSNRSVIDGLRSGVEHGYLICEGGDKPKTVKSYRLKMQSSCEISSQEESNQSCEESSQASYEISSQDSANLMKNLHSSYEESSQPSKKDTKERNFVEKNITERKTVTANASTPTNKPAVAEKKKRAPKEQTPKQIPLPVALNPGQQAAWDEWCKMPWFKATPKMQKNDPNHLGNLAAYNPNSASMLACKGWAMSSAVDRNGYYKTRGWSLYALQQEYPRWLSLQPAPVSNVTSLPERKKSSAERMAELEADMHSPIWGNLKKAAAK